MGGALVMVFVTKRTRRTLWRSLFMLSGLPCLMGTLGACDKASPGAAPAAPPSLRASGTQVTLSGCVTAIDGKPVPGATVRALALTSGKAQPPSAVADPRGCYHLGVTPGEHVVVASATGMVPAWQTLAAVSPDNNEWNFQLVPGTRVRGVVTNAEDVGLEGIAVSVRGEVAVATPRLGVAATRSKANGEFELWPVLPGLVSVCASAEQAETCVRVPVRLGEDIADVRLRLDPPGVPKADSAASA